MDNDTAEWIRDLYLLLFVLNNLFAASDRKRMKVMRVKMKDDPMVTKTIKRQLKMTTTKLTRTKTKTMVRFYIIPLIY